MKAIIDFSTDTILSWGKLYESDPEAVDVPDDYSPERYDYVPEIPGVYDREGFIPKPPPETIYCEICKQHVQRNH
jgi:hypothetical protein